jgi:catechol 2,3-dioxygenase-like lactoylglutathione lyase family enzyme
MPIDIRGLAPLLQVFDMPTAIHFYREVLGFEVSASSEPGDDCNWGTPQVEWRGTDAQYGL